MDYASIIDAIVAFDHDVTLLLNSASSPLTDKLWLFFSSKTTWIPMYAICAWFLFARLGWKKALIVLAFIGLAFGLCDQISNLVKYSVGRLRPSYDFKMISRGVNILEGRGGFYGFFSAHAANSFTVAICLFHGLRSDKAHSYNIFACAAFAWAFLVAVSRIFVGKHFFLDVVVGMAVGLAAGYIMSIGARQAIKYLDKKTSTIQEAPTPS